ncbi:hypothetical protein ARMGADRAFT_574899 [Armillaria gallica]|uniref:Uncharacterized protein n=1 Tax=Armillaria gallica TaxID=47427 RepID=A0A2H3E3T6_ARMGA|nr:hypothetical protein ARMGADRAFT_574899 [Armillaria gallica]
MVMERRGDYMQGRTHRAAPSCWLIEGFNVQMGLLCSELSRLLPFLVRCSRLVMFSFGFQQAFHRGIQAGDGLFFNKCLSTVKTAIRCMDEELAPSGIMRMVISSSRPLHLRSCLSCFDPNLLLFSANPMKKKSSISLEL